MPGAQLSKGRGLPRKFSSRKVGVFDSGIGGVTVLHALRARFPGAEFVYLGDTANVPYGPRSPSQIKLLAGAAAAKFGPLKIDALVVACNTASSLALDEIKAALPDVPVFGVVEAGVHAMLSAYNRRGSDSKILILATRATAKSGVYSRLLKTALGAEVEVTEQACPLLVPLIEEGWVDHPILHQTLAEYVGSYAREAEPGIALLACTHYPWIKSAFEKALPGWQIVNSATAVADLLELAIPSLAKAQNPRRDVEWIFTDPDVVPQFIFKSYSGSD